MWPQALKLEPVVGTPESGVQTPDSSAVPWVGAPVDHRSTVCGLSLKVGAGRTNSLVKVQTPDSSAVPWVGAPDLKLEPVVRTLGRVRLTSSDRLNDTLHIKRYSLRSSLVTLQGVASPPLPIGCGRELL